MKKQRKHYTAEEKVAILRRHLLEQEPIAKLCDELGLQPTVFYRWQKEFFENGARRLPGQRPLRPPGRSSIRSHRKLADSLPLGIRAAVSLRNGSKSSFPGL